MLSDNTLWHALARARELFRRKERWTDDDAKEYVHLKPHLIDLCRVLTARIDDGDPDEELAESLEEVRSYLPRPEA